MRCTVLIFTFLLVFKIGLSQNDNYKQMRLFNKLWIKIDENYPSFKLKGVNWHAMYNYIKPKITPGEYLVLSLKDLPYVKIVGDRTEGILGGSKIGFLPYGWIYGVNKWKVTSRNGVWYEDIGIPTDYLIQNKIGNLKNRTGPLIENAIEIFEN